MADFDPDAYIAAKSAPAQAGFNPDAYLESKGQKPERGILGTIANSLGASPAVSGIADLVGKANPIGAASSLALKGAEMLNQMGYDAGGHVTDFMANHGASPTAAAATGAVANAASQTLPQILGGIAAKAAPMFRSAAEGLMTRAVNPSLGDLANGKAARAISTMLDEGFSPTVPSMNIVRSQINELQRAVDKIKSSSSASVDLQPAYDAIQQSLKRFKKQANPTEDMATIRNAWQEFLDTAAPSGQTKIPFAQAQDIKTGTNQLLGEKMYSGDRGPAWIDSQRQITRGLKEGLEQAEPSVTPLNNGMSDLYNVLNVSERAALTNMKSNPVGFNMLIHSPQAMLAYTAGKSARFKTALAHMLNENQKSIPMGLGAAAGAAVNEGLNIASPPQ